MPLHSTIVGYVPTLQTTVDSRLLYQSSVSSSSSTNNNNNAPYNPNGIGSVSSDALVKNLTMLEVSRKLYKDSTSHNEHDNEGIDGNGCSELEKNGNFLDIYLDQKILVPQVLEKYRQFKALLLSDLQQQQQQQQNVVVSSKINIMPLFESYYKLNQVFYGHDCSCVTLDIKADQVEQLKKRSQDDVFSRPLLVIIRHGKTEVGWIDRWMDG